MAGTFLGAQAAMWIFKLLYVLVRNQLFLKPAAWGAARALRREVQSLGFNPRTVELWLDLGEAKDMRVMVFFRSDSELSDFKKSNHPELVARHFTEYLSGTKYPSSAALEVSVKFFSHEEVMRGGGYFHYFK
jgi:hypothetical protein